MKKISFPKIPFLALCLLGSSVIYSQTSNDAIAKLDLSSKQKNGKSPDVAIGTLNEKAVTVFNTKFTNATNIVWTTIGKNMPYVYFETPGKTHRAAFTKKGKLLYTISYYHEAQLPSNVLFQVKDTYFGKSIFCVTEVNVDEKTAYLIILEDKTSWLHIKIVDGEMIVEHVFTKG